MKKITEHFGVFLSFLIPVLGIALWVNGAYHGGRRHEVKPFDDTFGFFQCFYYGAERFWHEPDPEELNETVKMGAYLVLESGGNSNAKEKMDHIQTKEEFKDLVGKYTDDELTYVQDGINGFVDFIDAVQKETLQAMRNGNSMVLYGSKVNSLIKKCKTFGLKDEVEYFTVFNQTLVKQYALMSKDPNSSSDDLPSIQILEERVNESVDKARKTSVSLFSDL